MSVRSEYQNQTSTFDTKTNGKPVNIVDKMETQQASPSPTSDVIQQSPFIASSTSPTSHMLSSIQSNQNFPISNLEEAIRFQIEYYFSDANLANDKFLQSEFQKPEGEGQGYVTLELLSTFPKLRRMQADVAKIRESLKQSTTLVLNGDGTKVKRIIPFNLFVPEATVYVSFLPNNLCTQQQLQTLFGSFGTIANIDIPTSSKDGKQEPRGIAFVQFSNKEAASALLQQFKQHFHELHKSGVRVKPYSKAPPVYATTPTSAPIAIPQNSNQKSNRSPVNSPNRVSIYESTPTFNYSSSKGKTRKKRSDSKNDLESTWEPTSQSAEQRPKLMLKPRSASLPGPESTSPIATPSTPGGIVPIRQPKGPDNTKGFHFGSGRGKLVTTVS